MSSSTPREAPPEWAFDDGTQMDWTPQNRARQGHTNREHADVELDSDGWEKHEFLLTDDNVPGCHCEGQHGEGSWKDRVVPRRMTLAEWKDVSSAVARARGDCDARWRDADALGGLAAIDKLEGSLEQLRFALLRIKSQYDTAPNPRLGKAAKLGQGELTGWDVAWHLLTDYIERMSCLFALKVTEGRAELATMIWFVLDYLVGEQLPNTRQVFVEALSK